MSMWFLTFGLFLVLVNIFINNVCVDARNGDVVPMGSLFGSIERRHLKQSQVKHEFTGSFEDDKVEYPKFKRRKTKKKPKLIKHRNSIDHDSDTNKKHKKSRKRNKTFENKKFSKASLREADSKMSSSNENSKKRKPVDIIVHIKMND